MTNDAKELRILGNQIANDARKDLYLSYKMGIEKGKSDAIDEFVKILLDGEQNDEFIYSINQIAEQVKKQNSNSNSN